MNVSKIVSFFAPATFGVYLFHMQWDIVERAIIGRFEFIAQMQTWLLPVYILGCAMIIMFIGLLIDKLRGYIFKILKIDVLGERIFSKMASER